MNNPLFMNNPMRSYIWPGFVSATLLLAACSADKQIVLNLGEAEDYADYLEDKDDNPEQPVFKAEPLQVYADGEVRAKPDIAVITATITGEDKNESRAVNTMSMIINSVQDSLGDNQVETGFTAISAMHKYDETCQNANYLAQNNHAQITGDYWFNKRLDQQGDTKTKRRKPKPRLAQKVCHAQKIIVATQMVIRITPADAAGDVLQALSDAGAENAQLYGYDFTDYDALYQQAAQISVERARKKAQNIARIAGATLGELETFSVTAPTRKGRFGPQPNVIRPNRPQSPSGGSVVDRQMYKQNKPQAYMAPARPSISCWDGTLVVGTGQCPSRPTSVDNDGGYRNDAYANAGNSGNYRTELITVPPVYTTVAETVVVQEASTELVTGWDGSVRERVIPAVTKQINRRVVNTPASTQERVVPQPPPSNALSMSLLSGPQSIKVTAVLSYAYTTSLDGKIIVENEK